MHQDHNHPSDFGTGQKSIGIYLLGMFFCIILTIIAFWSVMSGQFTAPTAILIIYAAAITQFFTQIICFLRLNFKTRQGKINVMAFAYVILILICIIMGSIWIMVNLGYNMIH